MRKDNRQKKVIAAEADLELIEQIDAIGARWERERPGTTISRSDVIRALILAGLQQQAA